MICNKNKLKDDCSQQCLDMCMTLCNVFKIYFKFNLGNGVVIHLGQMFDELKKNEAKGLTGWKDRLLISSQSHIGELHYWVFHAKDLTAVI